MDNTRIAKLIKSMRTVNDLAVLLELIKRDECGWVRHGISESMLKHFSSDAISPKRFRSFKIRKKSGGMREIKAPCAQLATILKCVNVMLNAVYVPSDAAMGFTSGRSVQTNAQAHVGHNYVFNIDLKNFFPSIPQARVWKRLQLPPFSFPKPVANVLAGLCCSFDETMGSNVLPQGSPASPLLTNAICDNLDRRMKGVAKRFGLHYTRYADDMTFSSMHNVYREGSAFREEIQRIITDQGFRMNDSKTRLQKKGGRQEVTGLTVNEITNVSRKYISDLRWILNVWEREGYAKAYALFYPKYKSEKGYIKKGEPVMENVIGGKLNYLQMVKGATNRAYKKLEARYQALQELVYMDNETDDNRSYVYVQPYTVKDFESLFHTSLTLEVSRDRKVVAKCEMDGRKKYISVSKTTQKLLCPEVADMKAGEVIDSKELADCFVTLCRSRGKNFWLITKFEPKRSRCLSIQNLRIDPEELLTLWEREGFDVAADELAMFIQYGKAGDSILDWSITDGSGKGSEGTPSPDRGISVSGREYLLRYFMTNRHLTPAQKRRVVRQLTPIVPEESTGVNVEHLLDVWEKDGLDAAVAEWKELTAKKTKPKRKPKSSAGRKRVRRSNSFHDWFEGWAEIDLDGTSADYEEAREARSNALNAIFSEENSEPATDLDLPDNWD